MSKKPKQKGQNKKIMKAEIYFKSFLKGDYENSGLLFSFDFCRNL